MSCHEWALRVIDDADRGDSSYTTLYDACMKERGAPACAAGLERGDSNDG